MPGNNPSIHGAKALARHFADGQTRIRHDPARGAARMAASRRLRWLVVVSDPSVCSFVMAGWSSSDLLYAVDHQPGGRARRERLANVVHPDGRPLPSPAQQRWRDPAEVARRQLAESWAMRGG